MSVTAREWLVRADDTRPWDIGDAEVMRDALLAVLDLHKPITNLHSENIYCWQCGLLPYPCLTVKTINEALGVSDG